MPEDAEALSLTAVERSTAPTAITVALAALAGFVDVIVFLALGLFAGSGGANSTRLGVALATGIPGDAFVAGALLLAFVAGVVLAAVAARTGARARAAVLALVTLLLAIAAGSSGVAPARLTLLSVAAAAGALHLMLARDGAAGVTAALTGLGDRLASALMGEAPWFGWVAYLGLWCGFAAGAVMGAGVYIRLDLGALWVAAGVAAVATVVTAAQ